MKWLALILLLASPSWSAVANPDEANDWLRISANLPGTGDFTICFKIAMVDEAEWAGIFTRDAATGDHVYFGTRNTDVMILIISGVQINTTDLSGRAGEWLYYAATRSGDDWTTYLNGEQTGTVNDNGTWDNANMSLFQGLRFTGDTKIVNIEAVKFWDAALTIEAIRNEMMRIRPVRLADLYGWWPLIDTSNISFLDFSGGLAHDWTEAGAIENVDGSPTGW